jgi:hypothetical protein
LSTAEYAIIVGVFKEEIQAKSAIDVFRDAGFGNDQISFVVPRGNERSYSVLDNLVNLGLAEEEVSYYKSEFDAGRSIVVIRHEGRRSESLAILLLNGARNYRYLKMSMNAGKNPSDPPTSASVGLPEQSRISQHSSFARSSAASATQDQEALTGDEIASLRRLLEREGLDHLL